MRIILLYYQPKLSLDFKEVLTPILILLLIYYAVFYDLLNIGSKELGIPTANLSMEQLGSKGESLKTGIYYGKALLRGNVYDTVVSVGWNPFYKNVKKTVEAHLIAQLDDFYDEEISSKLLCIFNLYTRITFTYFTCITVVLFGYLRDETNFNSLGKRLIYDINILFTYSSLCYCIYDTTTCIPLTHTIIYIDELISCINQDIALSIKYLSNSAISSQYSEVDQLTTLISHTHSTSDNNSNTV